MKKDHIIISIMLLIPCLLAGCASQEKEITVAEPTGSVEVTVPEEEDEEPEWTPIIESGDEEKEEAALPTEEAEGTEDTGIQIPEGEDTGVMKKAVNKLNWDLYKQCNAEDNLFYSPFGIVSAIAITDLAAEGDTKAEIEKSLNIEDLNSFLGDIKNFSGKAKGKTSYFTNAAGLFIDKSLNLNPSFEEDVKNPAEECFNGEVKGLDFKNDTESAKKEISQWVNDKTEGMISGYESSADRNTVADILSAVYFYGEWESKFMADDTFTEAFHGSKGDTDIDMMHMHGGYFRYLSDKGGVKAVALPYAGEQYEMDILIPSDTGTKGVTGLFDKTSPDEVLEELDNAGTTELAVLALPKFKMEPELEGLKDKLMALGMKTPFSGNADFSKLADNITISDICHKAKVEVDEEGSRAAAVTEIMMSLTSAPDEGPKEEFRADRPFVFLIRDRESGVILFSGRVNDLKSQ